MARITLQPASILQCIPLLLPQGTAAPRSAPDALAALIHAINTAVQLQLVAVTESSASTSSSSTTDQSPSEDNVLPASWNARSPDFTLKYREPQSNQIILVKILKLGNKSQIHGILEQKEETCSLDVITNEYVSPTFFSSTDEQERAAASDLVHGYVSSDRMAEFITKYIKDVLRPLLPELNYEPREDSFSSLPPSEEKPERSRLLRDENQTNPPPLHQPYSLPNRQDNPLEVGRSDLDPFANPFAGKSPLQPLVPGGGMYVGPDHPMFGPRGGIGGQPGRSGGPWGGDGYLPPLGAPPGARFDPVGPLQGIGGGIGRLPGPGGRGPQPRGGGPFSGDPDNDEFMPPGRGGPGNFPDDMYM